MRINVSIEKSNYKKSSTIPIVNLADYFDETKKEQFIEEIRDALHTVGFFAVTNTRVRNHLLNNLYDSIRVFFAKSKEEKMQIEGGFTNNQRGYTSFGRTSAKGSEKIDFKEYFSMGREISNQEAMDLGSWQNIWPDCVDLECPAKAFYAHIEEYANLFQEIFALALGEDKDFLHQICENGDSSCRMIHYPISKGKKDPNKRTIWAGAHTDINLFTILPRATGEGLEVYNKEGKWIPVFVNEDAFIINAGDFLEIFSNGYFRSSLHRVLEPFHMKTDRYSTVMFVHPRSEEFIYPILRWVKKTGGKEKYIKATRMEMLMERLADMGIATDKMLKSLAKSRLLERLMTVDRASKEAMRAVYNAGYASDVIKEKLLVENMK